MAQILGYEPGPEYADRKLFYSLQEYVYKSWKDKWEYEDTDNKFPCASEQNGLDKAEEEFVKFFTGKLGKYRKAVFEGYKDADGFMEYELIEEEKFSIVSARVRE